MSERLKQREMHVVAQQRRTASDLILDYLLQIDVDRIFGIPDNTIKPFFDAIARLQCRVTTTDNNQFRHKVQRRQIQRQRDKLRTLKMIVARHEAGAVFMADGYSRETGRLGVCYSATGPGSTNLITGVVSAYIGHIPMLIITSQTALPDFGKRIRDSSGGSIDIIEMLGSCTRYNTFVSHIDQLEGKLFQAICTAFHPPYGPVHLSIPVDIMNQQLESKHPSFYVATMLRQPKSYNEQSLKVLSSLLFKSKKVVFFLDEGCLKNAKVVVCFAEMINADIVTSPMGKGCISAYHPLYKGIFGFAGHKSARDTLANENVDTILAIGTTLDEFEASGWCAAPLLNKKLVHIDATNENFSYSPMVQLHVHGHLGLIFTKLINQFSKHALKVNEAPSIRDTASMGPRSVPDSNLTSSMPGVIVDSHYCNLSEAVNMNFVKPQFLMYELARKVPGNVRFYIDTGNSWAWATHYLHLKNTEFYRSSTAYGAMGWAIGAAIGSTAGSAQPSICITGDSAYLMSAQEITVAVEHQLPVIFVILNNQSMGEIKHEQRLARREQIAFKLPSVDFSLMARSVGANAISVCTPNELTVIDLEALCQRQGPTLIDVHLDPEYIDVPCP